MKNNLLLLVVMLFLLSISCKKIEPLSSEVTSSSITRLITNDVNSIPFADSATLAQFDNDKVIINYKVARKMALLQLGTANNRNDMNWTGYTISEEPVLVYGFDSKPKYYEFIMYDAEHNPAGTCITYAKKTAPTVVSDLITGVRDYASIITKGNGGNLQFFAGAGTSLYIGIPSKSGGNPIGVIDPKTGKSIAGNKELTDEEKVLMLSQMNKNQNDSLKNILNNTTNPTAKGILKQSIDSTNPLKIDDELQIGLKQYHTARDTFWNGVTRIEDSLIKISDAAITGNTKGFFDWLGDWFKSIFRGPQTSSQMIEKYKNATDPSKYTDIIATRISVQNHPEDSRWCGPAAMSWMYYVYSGDPYQYDYFLDNAGKYPDGVIALLVWLWTKLEIGGRPMSPSDMFFSMANITNWDVIIAPWLNLDMNGGSVYQNLQYSRKPSIVATFEEGQLHWYVAYGCDRTTYWYGWSDYYFYIYDNGAITGSSNSNDGTGIYLHKKMASYPVASLPVWRD